MRFIKFNRDITVRMHRSLLFCSLFLWGIFLSAQDKNIWPTGEYFLSVNRTTLYDDNTENRSGFGAGVNFFYNSDKRFSMLTGIEYNYTRQFKYEFEEGRWCQSSDWDISMHLISLPVGFRYRPGSRKKFLLESGVFVDIPFKSTNTGEMCCYSPDFQNPGNMIGGCRQVTESGRISPGFGVYAGVGYRIPISKVDLILMPDYKFVINRLDAHMEVMHNRYVRLKIKLKIPGSKQNM